MEVKDIKIQGKGYELAGTLLIPENGEQKLPAVVFYHGMVSQSKPRTVERAKVLAKQGIAALTFDFRGCGESDGKLGELSIHNWFDDALLAFDFLSKQDFVDKNRIGISGKSFGGYMAALVCEKRNIKSIVVQAPGLYKDDWFDEIYQWDDDFKKLRWDYRNSKDGLKNRAIWAIERYKNPLLVVASEHDDFCPRSSVQGYYNAAGSTEKKLIWIKGADHPLTEKKWNNEYVELMADWFEKTL